MKRVSWKTTLGGIVLALGTALESMDEPLSTFGRIITPIGALIVGLAARDDGVTSEGTSAPKKGF